MAANESNDATPLLSLQDMASLGIEGLHVELARATSEFALAVGNGTPNQNELKERMVSLEEAIALAVRA